MSSQARQVLVQYGLCVTPILAGYRIVVSKVSYIIVNFVARCITVNIDSQQDLPMPSPVLEISSDQILAGSM